MDRTQRLLAGVLALQAVLLLLFNNPFTGHGATTDRPLLPGLQSMTPEKLEIDGEQGASVTLERSGGAWTLAQPAGYPVAPGKAEKLIQDLEHLSAHHQVVSNRRYHAALKVADDDFLRRVRVWEKPSGAPQSELFVGTSPSYGVSHVRVAGSDRVFEANGLNSYDLPADAASWIDKSLVSVPASDADSIALTNPKGSFTLVKRAGGWTVRAPAGQAGAPLDPDLVDGLVRSLCGMTLDQPIGPVDEQAQGLAHPEVTVTIARQATGGGSTPESATVAIGGEVPGKDGERYATRTGSGFAVTLAKYAFERAEGATLKELLKK